MKKVLRTDKNTRILLLLYQLSRGIRINKEAFSLEHGISGRTFERDIGDIRIFLSEIYSHEEVYFDKQTNSYYLSGNHLEYMDRRNATVIASVILGSKAFREDEMKGIFQSILLMTKPKDAEAIKEYFKNDMQEYTTETQSAIIKILGDLYAVIKSGKDILIDLTDSTSEYNGTMISPLQIMFKSSKFVLIAAKGSDLNNIVEIPVDHIIGFKVLNTVYAKTLQDIYKTVKEKERHGN